MPMKPLIDADTIADRVAELGREITHDFGGKDLVIVPVLKGSYVFAADLVRHIDLDMEVDFLGVRSYGHQQESSGVVQITTDLSSSIEGKHVILVEDIVDTGLSMEFILNIMKEHNPASLIAVTLLHKADATRVEVPLEYVGFVIKNHFVIGYGLDYAQLGRNLPDIYIIDEEK